MKFILVVVLIHLAVHVVTIQRSLNFIEQHFSKINIYCLQNFVNKGVGEQSYIQCAIECSSFYSQHCKAFTWNRIDETCMTIDNIVKRGVDGSMQLEISVPYKDGCTNKGYYYDVNSNTCLKMFVDGYGKTWKEARNHCQENGGDLLSLTTSSKYEFVTNFTSCRSHMWIGLKDKIWVTNATFDKNVLNVKTQFNNADSGYPEDSELGCGKFAYTSSSILQDESCNLRRRNTYVCEILV